MGKKNIPTDTVLFISSESMVYTVTKNLSG